MSNGQLTAVLIVAIVMIASIFKAKYGYGRYHRRREGGSFSAQEQAENLRLRDEVKTLRERLQVLERKDEGSRGVIHLLVERLDHFIDLRQLLGRGDDG